MPTYSRRPLSPQVSTPNLYISLLSLMHVCHAPSASHLNIWRVQTINLILCSLFHYFGWHRYHLGLTLWHVSTTDCHNLGYSHLETRRNVTPVTGLSTLKPEACSPSLVTFDPPVKKHLLSHGWHT
jgi:hypothetical protein